MFDLVYYDLEIIRDGLISMVKRPREFFKDMSRMEINLAIPIIILVITGLMMMVVALHDLPNKQESWKTTDMENYYVVPSLVRAEKVKAMFYPIWLALFWVIMTLGIAKASAALGGWGEFRGFFNCTSFLIYPYFLLILLRFFLSLFPPKLLVIYYVLLVIVAVWTLFLLIQMAYGAGELDTGNAIVAFLVPAFFFALLWYSYEPVVNMLFHQVKK